MKTMLATALLTAALSAQAATAFLVSSYVGTTVTGMPAMICVYDYGGNQFTRAYPMGTSCPYRVEVQ